MKKKITVLQAVLTVISISCLLISNIVVAKQLVLPLGFTMTCAMFVFPITYVLSDVFSEVYGYKWSRFTCYLGFSMNLLMVLIFQLSIAVPAPDFWGGQEAFVAVLGNTPRMLGASLAAFVAGDFVNDKIFEKMKQKHKNSHKGFCLRAILSSFFGEFTDSLIFIPVAFIGVMSLGEMISLFAVEVSLKTLYEALILPITNIIVKKVSNYEEGGIEWLTHKI